MTLLQTLRREYRQGYIFWPSPPPGWWGNIGKNKEEKWEGEMRIKGKKSGKEEKRIRRNKRKKRKRKEGDSSKIRGNILILLPWSI